MNKIFLNNRLFRHFNLYEEKKNFEKDAINKFEN